MSVGDIANRWRTLGNMYSDAARQGSDVDLLV